MSTRQPFTDGLVSEVSDAEQDVLEHFVVLYRRTVSRIFVSLRTDVCLRQATHDVFASLQNVSRV